MNRGPVLIVGGGIAGLTLHIALQQRGVESVILEKSPLGRLAGGGLWLWTNALLVLQDLDLSEAVSSKGTELHHNEYRTWAGDTLHTMPVGDMGRTYGAPSVIIARAELMKCLRGRVAPDRIIHDFDLVDCGRQGDVCFALARDGRRWEGSLIVGADGMSSVVRQLMIGDGPPLDSGQVAWVGLTDYQHRLIPPKVAIATLGSGLRFWVAGLRGGKVCWYGIVKDTHHCETLDALARLFDGAHHPVADIIRATRREQVVVTPMRDRLPLHGWFNDWGVLIGDSAHPSTPDLGQGAGQAMESAVALARWYAEEADQKHALSCFEQERSPRTTLLSSMSATTVLAMNQENIWLNAARDLSLATHFPWISEQIFSWVLGSGSRA